MQVHAGHATGVGEVTYGRLDDTFHDSVKIERLATTLGIPDAQAAGHLAKLWSWALTAAPDGDVSDFEPEELERRVKWTGEHGRLYAALIDDRERPRHRFLDRTQDGLIIIHDFDEHSEGFKRATQKREYRRKRREFGPGQPRVADASEIVASDQRGSERIREDQNRAERSRAEGTPDATVSSQTPPVALQLVLTGEETPTDPGAEPVLVYPAVGRGPSEWTLTRRHLDELIRAYPALEVEAEMRKALAKINTGAVEKKTARGYPRALASWLDRSMANPRGRAQSAGRPGSGREDLPVKTQRNMQAMNRFLRKEEADATEG